MKNHMYRNLLLVALTLVALFQIYPTIGWMLISDEARQARLETFKAMDEARLSREPSFFRDTIDDLKRWALFDRDRVINLGLDLQGGIHMVVGFDMTDDARAQDLTESDVQDMVLQRIERRINEFEAKEPIIQKLGSNQIQIQLPGEKDTSRAIEIIKKTAYLTFHMAKGINETERLFIQLDQHFNNGFIPLLHRAAFGSGYYSVSAEHYEQVRSLVQKAEDEGVIPENLLIAFGPRPRPWEAQEYPIYVLDREPAQDGAGLRLAKAGSDPQRPGKWKIDFQFEAEAANKFAQVTASNIGTNMAIVIDGVVISAPTIQSQIVGQGEITGNFTANQAQDLAIALNSGSMPVPVREDSTNIIGPTLGADSIEKGVWSSIIGLILVFIMVAIYYRLSGIIADLALIMNAILVLAAMAYFNATLTLPGIAGLILSIGMAVDANVLIFERIREELRNGKSLLAAIDMGYNRAAVTILDANITTLIAGFVLFEFGTGPVEGFAVTLCIGVITSVITALPFTRAIFDFLTERKLIRTLTMMVAIKDDTNFDFMKYRKAAAMASLVMMLVGAILFGIRFNSMFGVDFREGTSVSVTVNAAGDVPIEAAREAIENAGFPDAIVTEIADQRNQFLIRTSETYESTGQAPAEQMTIAHRMQAALLPLSDTPDASVEEAVPLLSEQSIGPAVGEQLRRDAFTAMMYSLVCILLYVAFRFEFWYAVGAIFATFHDVVLVVAIFAITGKEITMNVVAALLTVIGYSLNDTIVVYDRIREDRKLYRGKGYSIIEIMNRAINQTLGRTVLTGGTTLVIILVLLFMGGSVIHDFAFALLCGILIGTYSSVFVASPFVYYAEGWWAARRQKRIDARADTRRRTKKKSEKPASAQ